MRILTDDPPGAAAFFATSAPAEPVSGDLAPFDPTIARALGLDYAITSETPRIHPFWSRVILLSEARSSQFDIVDGLLRDGMVLPGPVLSVALSGHRFRGQREREWIGAPGNLHVTAALPLNVPIDRLGAGLSALPALAAADAIVEATGCTVRPGIKWVNDVVVEAGKIGGVLTVAHTTGRLVESVVWGIGINVSVAPAIVPTPFVPAAACLSDQDGGGVTLPQLVEALARAIESRVRELLAEGPQRLVKAYRRRSVVMGRAVAIWDEVDCAAADPDAWGPPLASGIVVGIGDDLSLKLEGYDDPITHGRLAFMPAPAEAARPPIDPAIVAAITVAVATEQPGCRVMRIEERR
jgi:biotin-(acetyl-CoA carboxylase) ligase